MSYFRLGFHHFVSYNVKENFHTQVGKPLVSFSHLFLTLHCGVRVFEVFLKPLIAWGRLV